MRFFFDTSVLIPVFLEGHPHHAASLAAFRNAEKKTACCAAHSLAEVYATVTRLPGSHRLTGEQALLFLGEIRDRLTLVALEPDEYQTSIEDAAAAGITGGTVYDALLATCALKVGAEIIYTWDVGHFRRVGPAVAKRVRTP